ncbi:LmeA family phospholipid-binding protein [Streptomyces cavernicola]|uniref:DUF2993 domain-containing protein n=1 Tax=Streptomyces cavernicola TaxID=3043613 RepID=A0ABT6SD59_9ACTN|nr:DUF2993 domain-containing protein [Streptomyces sp. B-S-A6]MDI3405206.1 DUF2993 domain-containing protein [Streptomyces sp. B-S-A6]
MPDTSWADDDQWADADNGEEKDGDAAQGKGQRKPKRAARRIRKTVVTLVVLLAFLALGDRWAVLYAENLAAHEVQKALKLRAEPEVHIDSFPFLAQVAMGDLDHVEVNVPDVAAGPVSVAQVKVGVDDIRLVGSLPSSVKGAVLGRVRGEVFLEFADLNREVGASQVKLEPGKQRNTVLAHGDMPVAGKQVKVRADAEVQRTGDHGVRMKVENARLVVPGLLTYTPGKGGGLQLAAPAAGKVDAGELQQATGQRTRPDQLLKGRALDALVAHPSLLKPTGIDPSLIAGLQKVQEPKVAEAMEFSAQLPDDMPVDLRLEDLSITKDGVLAQLAGDEVEVG